MEVKINREIREYSESIFFGLNLRQFIFSVLACVVAVIIYFILRPYFGIETLSWVCILGAIPFALLGFLKYNGMTAEKVAIAFIKSEILMPKRLLFKPINMYDQLLKSIQKSKNGGFLSRSNDSELRISYTKWNGGKKKNENSK